MTSATLKDNGRLQRKTLSSQLDRLDEILDGLAEGLNDAVAGAAREAVLGVVRQAVQEAVHDALAVTAPPQPDPVRPAAAPPAGPATTWKDRVKAALGRVKTALSVVALEIAGRVRRCGGWGLQTLQKLLAVPGGWVNRLAAGCRRAGSLPAQLAQCAWRHRKLAGIVLGVGSAVGLALYLAGPLAASWLTGLNTALLAAGGRTTRVLRRLWCGTSQA